MNNQHDLLSLLERVSLYSVPINVILDSRDSDRFSQAWMKSYSEVEDFKCHDPEYSHDTIEEIRREAYLRAYRKWGNTDLAACTSDDFGLISDAEVLGVDNEWIGFLYSEYSKGKIPF